MSLERAIDPARLPATAVAAVYAKLVPYIRHEEGYGTFEEASRAFAAAFIDELLDDDETMERLIFAYTVPSLDAARKALIAAVQEDVASCP